MGERGMYVCVYVCMCMLFEKCMCACKYVYDIRVSMCTTHAIGMPSVCVRVWVKEEYVCVYVCVYFWRCCACKYVYESSTWAAELCVCVYGCVCACVVCVRVWVRVCVCCVCACMGERGACVRVRMCMLFEVCVCV